MMWQECRLGSRPATLGPDTSVPSGAPAPIATHLETVDPTKIGVPSDQREPRDLSHRSSSLLLRSLSARNLIATQVESGIPLTCSKQTLAPIPNRYTSEGARV